MRLFLLVCLLALTAACDQSDIADRGRSLPSMRWDHMPEATDWTRASLDALTLYGGGLTETVPADIDAWCPAYAKARPAQRRAFWAGLFSALAKHESTWNEAAVGGGGRWFGLLQISPATARYHGCAATSGSALTDGEANLRCAVRIAASAVARDGVVAASGRGVAADWGPMAVSSKREEIAAWTRSQSYCRG
ncbi:transglycosylase SLT domain-containing protein [Rhodovulum kholense]|uniref:Transglycosylase-like protein with SLT domain n=1 Tax=Rhodovulum kholense TaxID=453584 RepID=A0A8E3AQZ5_9RHOB|nr:transglycosylase SLT domain-containing protein [Rhodovulum kholense]PTW47162.1 transglycosylase-like protein with SLT domain [Rhodovulum kholense]